MKALSAAGIRTVAISVDKPEKSREMMVQKAGYTSTFLSDPKLEAIRTGLFDISIDLSYSS